MTKDSVDRRLVIVRVVVKFGFEAINAALKRRGTRGKIWICRKRRCGNQRDEGKEISRENPS